MASAGQALETALADMLAEMRDRLPPPTAGVPEPNVSIATVTERALAVGNWRGSERRGALSGIALKGGRLDAVVRFQFWADDPIVVDESINELHGRLLAAKNDLRAAGFLRVKAETTLSAEPILVETLTAWRKTTDYRVLYEFHYEEDDGARGLIATIPVSTQPGEVTTITDAMARWDNEEAPALVVRGRFKLSALTALSFIETNAPSGPVTLTRTFDGANGLPVDFPTLGQFHDAVAANPPERHAQVTFASLNDFLAEFDDDGEVVEIGDLDGGGVPDKYGPLKVPFNPSIQLATRGDRFEVAFQSATSNQHTVVYLRAIGK